LVWEGRWADWAPCVFPVVAAIGIAWGLYVALYFHVIWHGDSITRVRKTRLGTCAVGRRGRGVGRRRAARVARAAGRGG
jgi:hypothetical protein